MYEVCKMVDVRCLRYTHSIIMLETDFRIHHKLMESDGYILS